MRPEDVFFDGVTHIRQELIEEAQRYVFRKRIDWRRYAGGLAACLALALGLGMLFRFGGAGGGAPSGNSSGCDSGAVAGGGDTAAPEAPGAAESSFTADVLEVLEDGSLLVVPQPGSEVWSVADRVQVPTADVPDLPDVQPGDRVLVVYTGAAGRDFVEGVAEIRLLE